ncbi:tautomerase family protein [Nocardia transvalensis]|uniref:tautomerase family protein n=1 Tax=Nocardia transvalensis TaxID=37333 RepID=UPI0018953AED|nr:tautomerase family protein [Nocardia transvalensis]MBF6331083.1 tautomerase family protein [Nocardia transvalensis]
MPLITVTYPEGALPAADFPQLADHLIGAALRAEGAPDAEPFRDFGSVTAVELPKAKLFTTGRFAQRPTFRIDITCHDILASPGHEQALIKEVTHAVLNAAGLGEQEADSVWVLLHCVPEGHWGVAGQAVGHDAARQAAADKHRELSAAAGEDA